MMKEACIDTYDQTNMSKIKKKYFIRQKCDMLKGKKLHRRICQTHPNCAWVCGESATFHCWTFLFSQKVCKKCPRLREKPLVGMQIL